MTADAAQPTDLDTMHDELFRRLGELEAQVEGVLAAHGVQVVPKPQLADLGDE